MRQCFSAQRPCQFYRFGESAAANLNAPSQAGIEFVTNWVHIDSVRVAKRDPGQSEYKALTTATASTGAAKQPAQAILTSGISGAGRQMQNAQQNVLHKELLQDLLSSLEDSKTEEIVQIDLAGKTSIADVMIIASGRSSVHVGAIADRLVKTLKAAGVTAPRVEGVPHCDWVLVDAGDIILHIFRPEVRLFYNLEKMWSGNRPVELAGERRAM